MNYRILLLFCLLFPSLSWAALSAKVPTVSAVGPKPILSYIVDDFERGNLRAWWHFGDIELGMFDNGDRQLDPAVQGRALRLTGKTKDWVVGGGGRFVGIDVAQFNGVKLVLKGGGKTDVSGVMMVELYVAHDDAWRSRNVARREYALRYESKFVTTVYVNWKGWRVVTIPFDAFLSDSPRIKQPFWDKTTKTASGKLVQLQFVLLTPQQKGSVDVQVDTIMMVNDPNLKRSADLLDY